MFKSRQTLTQNHLTWASHTPLQSNSFKPTINYTNKHSTGNRGKHTQTENSSHVPYEKFENIILHLVTSLKLTVFSDPVQLHFPSLPHHCKHVSSAHSLSKSPPIASGESQCCFSPVCHITKSLSVHESNGSALNCPCSGPIGALWVKGYCWSKRGVECLRERRARIQALTEIGVETRLICWRQCE